MVGADKPDNESSGDDVAAVFGEGIEGTVDRYVAMTRATRQLVILTSC